MLKLLLICILFFISSVQLLTAQDEPKRSITELNTLLKKSKSDSERVNLLLEAALVYVRKPGMERDDFNSVQFFVNQAINLSKSLNEPELQARCFCVYSQLYRENNQKARAKKYIDSAISIFTKYNLKKSLADAYIELLHYYNVYSDSEWVLKVKYAELAEHLYKESGNKREEAATLKDLGDFYQIKEKDSIALEYLHEALAVYQSVQYPKVEGVYDLIGYILYNDGDYNQALKYGLLAVETAEKVNAENQELSTIYNRVGLTYYRLLNYQEAVNCFTKSFFLAVENEDTLAAAIIAPNVLNSYLRLGKQQELIAFLQNARFLYDRGDVEDKTVYLASYILAYLMTGNHKKAEPFVGELVRLVGDATDTALLRNLHRAIIPYYLATRKYDEMYKYLPANETICKRFGIISGLADNYLWWFKADSALGNYTAALAHYKLFKEASDSTLRLTASQQINQLMIQYETFKKDQAIASNENSIQTLTNQAKLQQANLKQATLVKNLTIVGIIAVLIIAGLLYRQNRMKQRNNNVITHKNEQLQHLLTEKEWLLKEIHHRVKNNLQIVMSLLNSQSAYIDNEPALTAIHDSQHRVHAMSLIHQKLYNTDNVSSIDMRAYVRELATYLSDSFNTGQRIRFEYNIELLEMDISQAVPLGLILNEAITNSLKYAFPHDSNGVISISLSNTTPQGRLLVISDNGIGIPPQLNNKRSDSLGMSLIEGLSGDLDGNFSIENKNGTIIKISFAHELGIKRPDSLTASSVSNN